MNASIKIENIESSYLEEIEKDNSLLLIFGGGITTETSLGYDIGYAVGWAADKVRDGYNAVTDWF